MPENNKNNFDYVNEKSTGSIFQVRLFWFYLSRTLTAFIFAAILILVYLLHFKTLPIESILIFISAYSLFNFIVYFSDKKGLFLYMLATDIIFSTFLIYFTGSHSSQFQFMYILIIIFAGFYLSKEKLYLISSFAIVVYSSMLNLELFKIIPTNSPNNPTPYDLSYYIGIQFIAIFLSSLIINKISDKLILQTEQIRLKEKKIKNLMTMKNRILDTVPSCMVTTNKDFLITYINENAISFFENQLKQSPLPGDYLKNFIPIEIFITEKDEIISRAEYVFKTGEVIGYTISKMIAGNNFDGLLILFQDLTEFKKLEKRVMFKNNLETLGEMASGIAHEIRNPLASITGSVQLLKESKLMDDELQLLTVIEDEIYRIDESVKNLLNFARNDAQDAKNENINKIILEVLSLFEKGFDSKISLIIDKKQLEKPIYFVCKSGRIKQVLWNILKNAEKAVQYSEIKKIYVTNTIENGNIVISIRDTGIGITPNDIENIFNPYFSKFAKGFGLGLSICKEIVEEVDGQIFVSSTIDTGTCFKVQLPLNKQLLEK